MCTAVFLQQCHVFILEKCLNEWVENKPKPAGEAAHQKCSADPSTEDTAGAAWTNEPGRSLLIVVTELSRLLGNYQDR